MKGTGILATTIDNSTFATQTVSEDPLLGFSGQSTASSPSLTPLSSSGPVTDPADMPGQRARLFAAGTKTGIVLLWNIRAPTPRTAETVSTVEPVRVVYTESPQISCLALSSLYLVHGGNDGLVQAWDPLGSDSQPIRTLNSRFAARARRRIMQAQASPQGVGINLFAAGAICLDPDATVLRGMVSLGTQLRYWSYSSSAADQYKSQKRRLRRSERGSNNGGERFSGATRSNLKDYIANEKFELDREKEHRKKEAQRFAGRFGTELMDGSEEEMMAYAAMLSQETLEQEKMRRSSDTSAPSSVVGSTDHSAPGTDHPTSPISTSPPPQRATPKSDEEFDADVAEAIRQSLASSSPPVYDVPIRQAKAKGRKGSSAKPSPRVSPLLAGSSQGVEMTDLEFAMQLSLAEEQSKRDADDGFPALTGPGRGKGKGRMG
jgi:WD40 repeat protein